ncbi:hypothetical protein [Fluviispira sanaruensis]|uniref:Uncharacterized protein n=1 Tax=Fluviispira sanaruensis TaxID=2493639 RepID=A0A4V0P219_FLUSA|nr:hypothetical protein [Fluviispira sanaruensis]BBH51687.1 hypothetical protein JCM31447_01040 [Fluviispira sanaruensis]
MEYKNNTKFLIQVKAFYGKYSVLLPWLSLLWGIISSFLLIRDYSKSIRLSVFTLLFLFFIISMSTWYSFIKNSSSDNIQNLKKIQKSLHKRKDLFEFFGSTATQYFVQYIFMFCLPFVYFKKSWFWFVLLLVFSLLTLWDPFWTRLFRYSFFRLLLRFLAFYLTFSFSFVVLFPKSLDVFYNLLLVFGILIIFPWKRIFSHNNFKWTQFISTSIMAIIMIIHAFLPYEFKFPLLSIWIEDARFSFEKPKSIDFKSIDTNKIDKKYFLGKMNSNSKLCSITPIIAPIGVSYEIIHEWYVDNQFIDKILLPEVKGLNNKDKFNTYSCKRYFPNIKNAKEIRVKAFLKNGIYIGQDSFSIKSD